MVSAVTGFFALFGPGNIYYIGFMFLLCETALWMYIGPTNAIIANCVDAHVRTRAFSFSILLSHALGDAVRSIRRLIASLSLP
jgi:hypothetical protein